MQLDEGLKIFLQRPLMIIVGTTDLTRRPAIGRGICVALPAQEGHVEVTFSGWQWPETVSNIRETATMAATFVSPSDYVTYQMKGKAWLRVADEGDLARASRSMETMFAELWRLGVPADVADAWLTSREAMVATLNVSEIYVQTPGPSAGMTARRPV